MRFVFYSILLFFLAFSAVWAYRVNYDTREVVNRIKTINTKILLEEEKLNMLEGEWAYLNRPERLSILSERFFNYLGLMPISAENYANIDAINIKSTTELNLPFDWKILAQAENNLRNLDD